MVTSLSFSRSIDFPDGSAAENPPVCRRGELDPWVGKISRRRKWQSTPVFLPGKVSGAEKPGGHSLWGNKELDMI